MSDSLTIDDVQKALTLPQFDSMAARLRMAPVPRPMVRPSEKQGKPRLSSVLILLFFRDGVLHLALTRRREDLNDHAGQISFPGGRREDGESLEETAVREAFEEIGIPAAELTILGRMEPIYIPPSDFEVHPFVAWVHNGGRPHFNHNLSEVAELLEVPVAHLLDPAHKSTEMWDFHGIALKVPFYDVWGHKVWGATAIMLSDFLERLQQVVQGHARMSG